MANKILFFSVLFTFVAACGPQLTAKEKEDLQTKANYEDDIRGLEPFIGKFEGKAFMKRSGRTLRGSLNIVAFIGSTSENKASVQATLSVYEKDNSYPFYDFNYVSNDVVSETLYLSSSGTGGGVLGGGLSSGATIVFSTNKNSLVMESLLFRFEAKRTLENKK